MAARKAKAGPQAQGGYMSIGTDIIKDALAEIGVASVVSPPDAESLESGRKKLNSMLEMWQSKNIQIDTRTLNAVGDELNEPPDCRNAIVANLAIECAPLFSNGKSIVSPELRGKARKGYSDVMGLYGRVTIPKKKLPKEYSTQSLTWTNWG